MAELASKYSKGYATEAAHAMAILAFRILKSKKVEIYCDAENVASTPIPLKLGFKLEYVQKGGWPRIDDKLAKLKTYSIFHENDLPKLEITW
ncbi:MAG: GNAT family N-acetyltransferase [Gammaproteobacteria bacterium]|jgi:RimJ/RimL family protein N-acetyltransferase